MTKRILSVLAVLAIVAIMAIPAIATEPLQVHLNYAPVNSTSALISVAFQGGEGQRMGQLTVNGVPQMPFAANSSPTYFIVPINDGRNVVSVLLSDSVGNHATDETQFGSGR